jgi:Ca2+-binding EF-hand superfamily protein
MMRTILTLGLSGVLVVAAGAATLDDDVPKAAPGKGLLKMAPKAIFKKMDANGDGKVTKDEFMEFMTKSGPQKLRDRPRLLEAAFGRADTDGDGTLSFEEFKALVERIRERAAKAKPAP